MQDVTETGEELLWTAGLATVTGALLFALFAATSWATTMLAPGRGRSSRHAPARAQPEEVSPTGQLTPVPWSGQ